MKQLGKQYRVQDQKHKINDNLKIFLNGKMFHRLLFILTHEVMDRKFYSTYRRLIKNQWKSYDELKKEQEKQLKVMIDFSYTNVPYYHKLFKNLNLKPEDINKIEDLEKLPILTKEIIKQNWGDFKPANLNGLKYYNKTTGGSTGTHLKYRTLKSDLISHHMALLYRGLSYGNYTLGDKMIWMGGSSILPDEKYKLNKRLHEFVRNIRMLSSFDMGEDEMNYYARVINKFKPKFIYSYASSIYFFAKWVNKNSIDIYKPQGVFTTSEKLYSNMRRDIETIFGCEVYDTYGVNDGSLSANECSEHCGLHIDTERGIMEVVNEKNEQLENDEGKILGTSLYNYAMPVIRYEVGDLGNITDDSCNCGRGHKLLKEIVGRSADIFTTPEGKNVHGWFFLFVLDEHCKGMKEYQVIQEKIDKIVIKIVQEDDFDEKQVGKINEIIKAKSGGWDVEFKLVDNINRTKAGKYKFIVSKVFAQY